MRKKTTEFSAHIEVFGWLEHEDEELCMETLLKNLILKFNENYENSSIEVNEVTYIHESITEENE